MFSFDRPYTGLKKKVVLNKTLFSGIVALKWDARRHATFSVLAVPTLRTGRPLVAVTVPLILCILVRQVFLFFYTRSYRWRRGKRARGEASLSVPLACMPVAVFSFFLLCYTVGALN